MFTSVQKPEAPANVRVLAATDTALAKPCTIHGVIYDTGTKGRAAVVAGDSRVRFRPAGQTAVAFFPADVASTFLFDVPVVAAPVPVSGSDLLEELLSEPMAPARAPLANDGPRPVAAAPRVEAIRSVPLTTANFKRNDTIATDERRMRALTHSSEVLAASGLDWTVSAEPLQTASGLRVPAQGIVRNDTRACLGVVGDRYKPVQNAEAFAVVDGIVAAGAEFVGAGSFGDGATVFVQVDLKVAAEVGSGDVVRPYVLVRNSHDGSGSLKVKHTPVRVVCWNTLNHATSQGRTLGYARHTGNVTARMTDLSKMLEEMREEFARTVDVYRSMSRAQVNERHVLDVLNALLPLPEERDAVIATANQTQRRDRVRSLFEGRAKGADLPGVRGTAWGLYNAVTEFADYDLARKSRSDEARRESVLAGKVATFKADAFEILMELNTVKVELAR